ncbi:hypothetical protein GOBAR_DD22428 [Gossypium barbadense]|nr:hypothetical protein GOBAR_DD22428 [Gossypium barbadense]
MTSHNFCYRYMCLRRFSFAIASFLCGGSQSLQGYTRGKKLQLMCSDRLYILFPVASGTYQKDFMMLTAMLDNTRNNMHLVSEKYINVRQLCRGGFPFLTSRYKFSSDRSTLKPILESNAEMNQYQRLHVWRRLQRLKNACYDLGFPRKDDHPCHTLFANWQSVCLSTSKEETESKDCQKAFWMGGQVTEEAMNDAISPGKVEFIRFPVEVGTAPSMEQVEKFASLVSGCNKRPIYLHSKEGVWRTSATVSRWRQYMTRFASQLASDRLSQDANGSGDHRASSSTEEKLKLQETNELLQETSNVIHSSNGAHKKEASSDDKELWN